MNLCKGIKLFALACALCCALGVNAANEMLVGRCEGAIATSTSGKIFGRIGKGEVRALSKLSADLWSPYVGEKMIGAKVGLPQSTTYPENLTLFVKEASTGANIAQGTVATGGTGGWKTAYFTSPITIEANKAYYIGFSYSQDSKLEIISCVGVPYAECILVGKDSQALTDYSSMYGCLSVEAIVKIDNVHSNLSITDISLAEDCIIKGDNIAVDITIKNSDLTVHNGFIVEYTLGGVTKQIKFSDVLNYRDSKAFHLSIPTNGMQLKVNETLAIRLLSADGKEDDDMSDNTASLPFTALTTGYSRNVIIEQFSTELCGWCPQGTALLKQAFDNLGDNNTRVHWATHHAGYGTDWLTVAASRSYEWFYGTGGTYAPAYMLNRSNLTSICEDGVPVTGISNNPNDITNAINAELKVKAPVKVEVNVTSTNNGNYELNISGERTSEFAELCASPRITVIITEDGINAINQASASNYVHYHVVRAICSDTWGDPISWNGNNFSANYTLTPNSKWVMDHVKAIVLVHAYNSADRNDCKVFNTAAATITDGASAVEEIDCEDASVVSTQWIDANGCIHNQAITPGIWMKVETLSNGSSRTTKMIAR